MMNYCFLAILLIGLALTHCLAENPHPYTDAKAQMIESSGRLPIWPAEGPAEENGLAGPEIAAGCVSNIPHPELSISIPEDFIDHPEKSSGTAVVIVPGGGYGVVCTDTEGEQIAKLLKPLGVAAIVVKYRLPNQHHLIPAADVRRAIRIVRHNAKHWGIDPTRVGVWGFSAGGHLASTVSTTFDEGRPDAKDLVERQSSRPDFSILFYPVITMENGATHAGSRRNLLGPTMTDELVERYSNERQVSDRTPHTFMLHAADDKVVPVENSLRYYRQLVAHGIPSRMLIFEKGGHGPGAFQSNPTWKQVFEDWISKR